VTRHGFWRLKKGALKKKILEIVNSPGRPERRHGPNSIGRTGTSQMKVWVPEKGGGTVELMVHESSGGPVKRREKVVFKWIKRDKKN